MTILSHKPPFNIVNTITSNPPFSKSFWNSAPVDIRSSVYTKVTNFTFISISNNVQPIILSALRVFTREYNYLRTTNNQKELLLKELIK